MYTTNNNLSLVHSCVPSKNKVLFLKLPGFSIRQSWDTWKEAVPKALRLLNMRLQSTGEFLYYLGDYMPIKHNRLTLHALILYRDGLYTYPRVPGTLLKLLLYPFLENYLVNSWRQTSKEQKNQKCKN